MRQALAWVIRLHSGEATSADAAALALWRQRSPEHDAAFREAVRLWRGLGDAVRTLAEQNLPAAGGPTAARRAAANSGLSRRVLIGGATAAAASLAGAYLVARPPLGLWPSWQELSADYRTAKGERRVITLADNISLTLNTQTSIAVRSTPDRPAIELISGEAAVQAAGEASAPVVIGAAGGLISARQASFNVRCLEGVVSVSCVDGEVEIEWKRQRAVLAGRQQLSYSAQAGLAPASNADVEQMQAWLNGLLVVRDWPVDRLVQEINRYRPGRIVIMGGLGRRMISGTFYLDHLDDFIAQVQSLFGASVRALPGGIVLLS
ncbi:FecR domain-containing protein [Bradyrhizobium sp. STM 3843]|uniref:FecR family protein n=1 Tax=Bradyrhizobium sp. STM 3843 TaxID=551947 RepID=UPI001FCC06C6|nr:FecR domain-containing protein [Bradyrhizobium sp. STM 3843]